MLSEDLNYSTHPQFPTKQFHSIHIETSTFKPSQATPKPCELKISRLFVDNYLYYPYAFDRTIIICINVCSETYFIVDPNTCVSWTLNLSKSLTGQICCFISFPKLSIPMLCDKELVLGWSFRPIKWWNCTSPCLLQQDHHSLLCLTKLSVSHIFTLFIWIWLKCAFTASSYRLLTRETRFREHVSQILGSY